MERRKFIVATALMGPLALAAEVTKSVEVQGEKGETVIADWLFYKMQRVLPMLMGNSL